MPRLRKLTKDNPRYGYRRLHALLLREGYAVNHNRVQRLCRDEGLRSHATGNCAVMLVTGMKGMNQ